MQTALDRYLRDQGFTSSILRDKEFVKSRKVLNGKAIELHEMGKGKRPMKADAINEDEEDHLWNSGVLGNIDPVSLNHTMFFFIQPTFWNSRTPRTPPDHDTGLENCERFCNKRYCIR